MLTNLGYPLALGQTLRQTNELNIGTMCNGESEYFTLYYDVMDKTLEVIGIDNTFQQMSQPDVYPVKSKLLMKIKNVRSIDSNISTLSKIYDRTLILQNTEYNAYLNLYGPLELEKQDNEGNKFCNINSEDMKENMKLLLEYWIPHCLKKFEISKLDFEIDLLDKLYKALNNILDKTYQLFLEKSRQITALDISSWINIIGATIGSCSSSILYTNGDINNFIKNFNIVNKLNTIDIDFVNIATNNYPECYNTMTLISDITFETLSNINSQEQTFIQYLLDIFFNKNLLKNNLPAKYTKLEFLDYFMNKLGAICINCFLFECMNKLEDNNSTISEIFLFFPLPQKYLQL